MTDESPVLGPLTCTQLMLPPRNPDTCLEDTLWPFSSRSRLFMHTIVDTEINHKQVQITASLDFAHNVPQPRVKKVAEEVVEIKKQKVAVPMYIPDGLKKNELTFTCLQAVIIGIGCLFSLKLQSHMAGQPVCSLVRFTYLLECEPNVFCAAPVDAPPGTRFFAHNLPKGVVLFPDTGNVTVPVSSKHVSFSVFAESPDPSGAPSYVQSVEVRHEQLLAQPESLAQMASDAAVKALFFAAGSTLYWLLTQG